MRKIIGIGTDLWLGIVVFLLGGGTYGTMEVCFRGYTHWTMLLTGGACVLTFWFLQEWLFDLPIIIAALAGAAIVTIYEFSVGCVVNLKLGWQIWDYSGLYGNILGQICPLFTVTWFAVSLLFFGFIKLISR